MMNWWDKQIMKITKTIKRRNNAKVQWENFPESTLCESQTLQKF